MTEDAAPRIAELDAKFTALKAGFAAEPYPERSVREDRLRRLEDAILAHADRLVAAISADFSYRPAFETRSIDLAPSLASVRHARRSLRRWMRGTRVGVPLYLQPARARILPQPKGVVGVISPWNYPVYLALPPVAEALAAGCRVMLKPSEHSPQTSAALAELIAEAFSPDEVDVVQGGAEVGAAFAGLPFDHLFFTGSTEVGRKVAVAAARNLTPVTLELGGKSPAVVLPGADLARAARRIAWGRTANAGQTCVGVDYVLVPRDQMTDLAEGVLSVWQRFFPEGTASADLSAVVNEAHLERLHGLVREAEASGARILSLNETHAPEQMRKMPPTLIVDPDPALRVMEEEIFGPILPILPYDSVDDAYAFVAARPRPLALYVFSQDVPAREEWLTQSHSGAVGENDVIVQLGVPSLPFGGTGASGMGAYHGDEGFRTFSHMKSVFCQPRLNGTFALEPPIGRIKRRLGRILERLA